MRTGITVNVLSGLLLIGGVACAQEASMGTSTDATPTQCVSEKITAAKLQQENAQLRAQLMQLQFNAVQQAGTAAKAEQDRLEKLQGKPAAGDPTATPPTNSPETNPKAASAGVN